MDSPEQKQALARYLADPTPRNKTRLANEYVRLVRFVAKKIYPKLPKEAVEPAELASWGTFGLLDAIDKYEPAKSPNFDTYAIPRIHGAILDGLRSVDHLPRSIRRMVRDFDNAVASSNDDSTVTTREIASKALDLHGDELTAAMALIERSRPSSLEESAEGGEVSELAIEDDEPELHDEFLDVAGDIEAGLLWLAPREQMLIRLYYTTDMTLREVGVEIGVTESRCCQLHFEALKTISEVVRRQQLTRRLAPAA